MIKRVAAMTKAAFERGEWSVVIEDHPLESNDPAEWLRYGVALLQIIETGFEARRQQQLAALAFEQSMKEGASAEEVATAQRQAVILCLHEALSLIGIAAVPKHELDSFAQVTESDSDQAGAIAHIEKSSAAPLSPVTVENGHAAQKDPLCAIDAALVSTVPVALLDSLREKIDTAIAGLLTRGTAVAHVGFPNHWNTGDSAIWLAEQASLERLGCEVTYQCGWQDYDPRLLEQCVGHGPILIAGGGNLGDLWPDEQRLRERVIEDFPANPVIQLPQSLCFIDQANLERFQRICSTHQRLIFMLRDGISHERATALFDTPTLLVPDMAFSLGPQLPPDSAADSIVPVFWLSRTDKESAAAQGGQPGFEYKRSDWLEPGEGDQEPWRHAQVLVDQLAQDRALHPQKSTTGSCLAHVAAAYNNLARLRLQRGLRMLSQGRVVVTDRLHGHILSLCMGRPNVLLDNSYGKVQATYQTWTRDSPITYWASSTKEALRHAEELSQNQDSKVDIRVGNLQ
jgi:pyruvyl transferase EpsO